MALLRAAAGSVRSSGDDARGTLHPLLGGRPAPEVGRRRVRLAAAPAETLSGGRVACADQGEDSLT